MNVIFHEKYYDRSASDLVGRRAGASVLVLPTSVGGASGANNYVRLMDTIVNGFVSSAGDGES